MIQIENINLTYVDQVIFDDISCSLRSNARVGLVGRNGSGKSTLLKAIAGQIQLDSGSISILGGKTIAYMPQDIVLNSQKSIIDEALTTFESLQPEDVPSATAEVKKTLMGLGFTGERLNQHVNQLSTGWKMRLVLAKLLLKSADFYLFDEPTNHLDIFAQEWFLQFLKSAKFGFLLVCHERAFLNKVCTQILELDRGSGTLYSGNYDTYIKQKQVNTELQKTAFEQQQKEIARKKATIARFKAKATKAKMAKSMQKGLDRIEIINAPEQEDKTVSITFPPIEKSGRAALRVNNVSKNFNGNELFHNVSFRIERGSKVALVAANGVGKTTLFKLITSEYPLEQGSIVFGDKVHYALFKQDQNSALNPNNTIWEEILLVPTKKTDTEIRAFLGAFLFPGDDIYKKIKVLSGGEKNRVSMVKALLQKSNFLLLDEPTNHLDIQSKDVLLSALKSYPGTILFVSHDHDFVNQLATHIVELTPRGTTMYTGNYDDYMAQKSFSGTSTEQQIIKAQQQSLPTKKSSSFENSKKLRSIEQKIEKLEQKREALSAKLSMYDYGSTEYTKLFQGLLELQTELDTLTTEWEKLISQ